MSRVTPSVALEAYNFAGDPQAAVWCKPRCKANSMHAFSTEVLHLPAAL